jgi:hypothetical protein
MPHTFFDRALAAAKVSTAAFAAEFKREGADANISNDSGVPLIDILLRRLPDDNLPPLLAILVEKKEDLEKESQNIGDTPLATAALYFKPKAYDFLLSQTNKAVINRHLKLPILHSLVMTLTPSPDILPALLEYIKNLIEVDKADVDITDPDGNSALYYAADYKLIEILKYLLSQKAGLFFGRKIPLVKAYEEYHFSSFAEASCYLSQWQTQKACLDVLVDATSDYFYQMALQFTGTEQELENEFEHWAHYISEMGSRFRKDFRSELYAFLMFRIFNPLKERLEKVKESLKQEKLQRLAFCNLGKPEMLTANSPYYHVVSTNQRIDKGMFSEIFSYTYGVASHAISIKDKFNGALVRALRAVNLTPRDMSGVWYFIDYQKYCDRTDNSCKEEYEYGFANPAYWEMTSPFVFRIKNDVAPSLAIKSFLQGFTIADCGSVIVACQYAALLNVLGEEKFNTLFDESAVPLTISRFIFDPQTNPIAYFFSRADKIPEIGDMCHFEGVSFYSVKHPLGHARGWTVVCSGKNRLDENLYYGFGPEDFRVNGVTERNLNRFFLNYYNNSHVNSTERWNALQALQEQNLPEIMQYREAVASIKGYEPNSTISPDWLKIKRYAQKEQLTADEFSNDYDNFLRSHHYPSFFSRPSSSSIVLPVITRAQAEAAAIADIQTSPAVRIGIPTFF